MSTPTASAPACRRRSECRFQPGRSLQLSKKGSRGSLGTPSQIVPCINAARVLRSSVLTTCPRRAAPAIIFHPRGTPSSAEANDEKLRIVLNKNGSRDEGWVDLGDRMKEYTVCTELDGIVAAREPFVL